MNDHPHLYLQYAQLEHMVDLAIHTGSTMCVWYRVDLHISANLNVWCQCLHTHARIIGATLITVRASFGAKLLLSALAALCVKRCLTNQVACKYRKKYDLKRDSRGVKIIYYSEMNVKTYACLSLVFMRAWIRGEAFTWITSQPVWVSTVFSCILFKCTTTATLLSWLGTRTGLKMKQMNEWKSGQSPEKKSCLVYCSVVHIVIILLYIYYLRLK